MRGFGEDDPAGLVHENGWQCSFQLRQNRSMVAERPGRFYALGNFGQYLYVAPDPGTVIVRNGRDWGVDNDTWLATFRDLADRL